jgi:hypothetical protein
MDQNDLRIREKLGLFKGAWNLGPGTITETQLVMGDIKAESDNIEGIQSSPTEEKLKRVILEQHCYWDLDGDGIAEPYVFTVDKETKKLLRVTKRMYIDNNGIEHEVEYFQHYYFFYNPEGYYGLGFGHILEGINEAASSVLNQIIDAGTLSNVIGGFINRRSNIKKGDIQFEMGKFKGVDVNADDIRKAIYTFDFKGPNTVLFSVLSLLQDYAKRVTTVSEALTGELPRSDTPATSMMAAIEQGMKVFSTIHKRIHRGLKQELKKLYRINSIYTDNNEYLAILGQIYVQRAQREGILIDAQTDYAGEMDVFPVSDPTIISRTEKVAIAEMVLRQVMSNPVTAQDPEIRREAYKRFYKAIGVPNYESLLEKEQIPPDLPQEQELAMMLNEQAVQALPQQNHLEHINTIDDFMESTYVDELTPRGKRLVEAHRRAHIAFQYLKEQGRLEQQPETGGIIPYE